MKQVVLNGLNFLLIEVPEGSKYFHIEQGDGHDILRHSYGSWYFDLPEGFYIIPFLEQLSPDNSETKRFVERVKNWDKVIYYDYETTQLDFKDIVDAAHILPNDSWNSFLRHHGFVPGQTITLLKVK